MVRGSNPGRGEIFRTCPDMLWGPPSLLYNGYRVIPGGKAAGTWRWPPTLSSAEVKERVELYLYYFSVPSWLVVGWNCNPLTHNDRCSSRTAPLTSKRCILYIYSTNIGTEYFKHGIYSQFFSSSKCSLFHNSNLFGSCIIHILYTGVLKLKKKIIPAPKG